MENEWCSIADVYAAYCDCKKRKAKSVQFAQFAANEAANIYDLWKDLNERTYTIGASDAFCVTRPKVREVFAAQFRDRIVHHFVMLRLLPAFESAFINDTYNCRKGKGTDYGIKRVAQFMNEHPYKVYLQPVRHGVTFVGSVIKDGRIYAGNRTIGNATNLIREFAYIKDKEQYIEKFVQRHNSYMGYMIHRQTYAIRWRLWNMVDAQTKQYVYMSDNLAVMHVRNKYKERNKLLNKYSHGKKNFQKRGIRGNCTRV